MWLILFNKQNKTKQNKQKKVKFTIVYDYKFKLDNTSS